MYRLLIFSLLLAKVLPAQIAVVGKPLPPWQPGYLDLHHINTGRGNAAFFIFPDGTNMVVDAGEMDPTDERTTSARNTPIRPDNTKHPFEWIADYIKQFSPKRKDASIDYALITHFHDDHFGSWYPAAPFSSDHSFQRTGITGVADLIPVHTLLTRDYHYPMDPDGILKKLPATDHYRKSWSNYLSFVRSMTAKGGHNEFFRAGSSSQIRLLYDASRYPQFKVRNIKSNGLIWTGTDSSTRQHFPPIDPQDMHTWPDENTLSNALVISYGNFRYYTGGDNPGNVFLGDSLWRDVESEMAPVIGDVDVATMDHHGNRDAVNPLFIKTLRPRAWIEQVWTADHPGHEVLIRIMSQLYDGPRDLFATNMMEANKLVIGPLVDRSYKSQQGHVVVRVVPGGGTYYIIILDDAHRSRMVKAVFGPYSSKQPKVYTTANAHAHNDYEHEHPFTGAYDAKFGSIEADIFLSHDSLIVGHTSADLALKRTLEALYLDPLQEKTRLNKGFPYPDTSLSLQLLIDIKTGAVGTLDKLTGTLKKYPQLTSCPKIHFVISGNRPPTDDYQSYPSFILFDGEFDKQYADAALSRVPLFSDNLQTYIEWNGHDVLTQGQRATLDSLIRKAHGLHKKIRFWNAPDFPDAWHQLMDAGVDYLNTDHIAEIEGYLKR